ncbi:MAG: APC family permease [Clostridiales bacterium]|nr:APC family permease [Clostridiales bacterium]
MDDKKEFNYTYSAPSAEEKKEIEYIRKQYVEKQDKKDVDGKMQRLRKLHSKVKSPAMAVSLTMGIVGTLIFGLGLSMALEWGLLVLGSLVAVVGLAPIISAYWAHNKILERQKKKYGEEILQLSQELLDEN